MIHGRDILRVALSLLLGPIVGGIVFFAAAALYETAIAHAPVTVLSAPDPSHLIGPIIFFSYFLGCLPALLTGIAASIIAHRTRSTAWRLVLSTIAGALASVVIIGWVVVNGDTSIAPPPIFIAVAAVSGGVAALVVMVIAERIGRGTESARASTSSS
jgi:hypothetical protein